jgi:hypothetical protein
VRVVARLERWVRMMKKAGLAFSAVAAGDVVVVGARVFP